VETSFRDYHLSQAAGHLGFPKLGAVDGTKVIVADWRGLIHELDLSAQSTITFSLPDDLLISGPPPVYNLAVAKNFCVLTLRTPRFFVWHRVASAFAEFYSEAGTQVHSAAVSPNGQSIALGLGDYPLDAGGRPEAKLEMWDIDDNCAPRFVEAFTFPGVCVDHICWSPHGTAIYCLTGMRNQQQAFLVQMDPWGRPIHFRDIDAALFRSVLARQSGNALVSSSGRVLSINMETGSIDWEAESIGEPPIGYDADSDRVLLGTGELLDAETGRQVATLRPLEDTSSVVAVPGNGWVAVSRTGVIRHWLLNV
jgi:hypothetical protein